MCIPLCTFNINESGVTILVFIPLGKHLASYTMYIGDIRVKENEMFTSITECVY